MAVIALALTGVVAQPVLARALPPTVSVDGQTLQLAGHGTRTQWFFIELYRLGLYLPRDVRDPQAIQQPDVPKALHAQIRYDGSLPDRIPQAWRSELMPALTEQQQHALRRHYQTLSQGDVITITYAPGTGTVVRVNGTPIFEDTGHEVMAAFLDLWIGRNPVSEDLKQALLG